MEELRNRECIPNYKDSVMKFCLYASRVAEYTRQLEAGLKNIDVKDFAYASTMLKCYKNFLLQDKEELGLTDGLSFMEDNRFFGFEIKDGRFVGDAEKVFPIIDKWLDGFPESANHYQYEVSCLVMCMAHPEIYNELGEGPSDDDLAA